MSAGAVRILVVDDMAPSRHAVSRMLRLDGFDVIEAALGAQALALANAEQPDLVVLDDDLPDISGVEVAKRLRNDPRTAAVSIVQVATNDGADADAASIAGADAYLVRPLDSRVLSATARALVQLRATERRLGELLERERAARAEAETARDAAQRAERALRASEMRFRRLSESGLIGLVRWDLAGPVLDANDAFLRMLGYSREDLAAGAIDVHRITPPDWQAVTERAIARLRSKGTTGHIEKQYLHKDGSRVDVLVAAALLDEPEQAMAFTLDISARRRSEHERGRLLTDLETAIRARDEFLAIAAHDLRNPLNTLQLQLQSLVRLAQRGPQELAANGRATIERTSSQLQDVVRLLDDLLDVSRIGSGRIDVELERVDLAVVARAACERMREQFVSRGSPLQVDAPISVIGMWDRIRLDQVMTNLLSNALKYGAGRPVEVSVAVDGGCARLVVADHGVGIEPENRERVFRQFERVRSGRDSKSFGLGLWIVRSIVEALGGRIWVTSEVGQGSSFIVELPCAAATPAGSAS